MDSRGGCADQFRLTEVRAQRGLEDGWLDGTGSQRDDTVFVARDDVAVGDGHAADFDRAADAVQYGAEALGGQGCDAVREYGKHVSSLAQGRGIRHRAVDDDAGPTAGDRRGGRDRADGGMPAASNPDHQHRARFEASTAWLTAIASGWVRSTVTAGPAIGSPSRSAGCLRSRPPGVSQGRQLDTRERI